MSKRLKILCLHGYRQNDVLFREKTGSLRKLFKKYADFEFVSAPLIPNVEENDREGARGWWFSKTDNQFSSKDVTEIATGFEESVEVVLRFISTNGPFDGIFGFSQGASMAHLLLAKEQLGEICYPKWKMGNKVSQDHSPGDGSFGQQFRVYIHRRNKIIHAWLRITADDIFLEKSKSDVVSWPLQLIRRYGYTSAGVFFFESGRRCRTGEGLHCFQTQNADIIFQLVQQRVQDNANVQKAKSMRRNERAQSSGPVLHSSINHPASRVNHIQRFGSEGGGVGSEYLSEPAGYNSYHQGSQATNRLRKVVLPPPPRPRSVGGEDDEPHHLPPSSFHPQRSHNQYSDQRIVGSILSESRNPSAFEDEAFSSSRRSSSGSQASCSSVSTSQFRPPYVNISTQEVLASPRIRSGSTSSRSSHSGVSSPTTPVRTAIPLKWNVGAGSTNLICYAQPAVATTRSPNFSPETIGSDVDGVFRYVNVTEIGGRPLLEKSSLPSPRLNYADVGPGEQERGPSRCSSIGQRSEVDLGNVNYTLIDADKTRALQAAAAASVDDRISNAVRRRNLTGGN